MRIDPNSPEYGFKYRDGWMAAEKGRADLIKKSQPWLDGWTDKMMGRDKWHTRTVRKSLYS